MGNSEKNLFKSGFLRINGYPLIDYHHGLLIMYSPGRPKIVGIRHFYFSEP